MAKSNPQSRAKAWPKALAFSLLLPVAVAVLVYQLDLFEPVPIPTHEITSWPRLVAQLRNDHMLQGLERVGSSQLVGPEDIIYDKASKVMYSGCADGWVKRVKIVGESAVVVENWVNTGGRPLGLAFGLNNDIVVADSVKGLLSISSGGEVKVLSTGAEGVEAKLIDGVDVADDGKIYFTDASSKYNLKDHIFDILEGNPNGRFLCYDPQTDHTSVLATHLYFSNGVAVSPDQSFAVYCETPMQRCRKYHMEGERKGRVDTFIENMPGMPDNIKYDGEGHFWIALASGPSKAWEMACKYPILRKIMAMMERYLVRPRVEQNGGVLVVDLQGKPVAHYRDVDLSFLTSAVKIGDHVYCGSLSKPYMLRLNLTQYPATPLP